MNFYPRWIGDYQRDTADLSFEEDAAYNRLLDTYYATEQPLAGELERLYTITRAATASQRRAVRAIAERFFPVTKKDGLRHNKRADREIREYRARVRKAQDDGRKGAAKRWGGHKGPHKGEHKRPQWQNDSKPSPNQTLTGLEIPRATRGRPSGGGAPVALHAIIGVPDPTSLAGRLKAVPDA